MPANGRWDLIRRLKVNITNVSCLRRQHLLEAKGLLLQQQQQQLLLLLLLQLQLPLSPPPNHAAAHNFSNFLKNKFLELI
jgi:hypothetical protein